MSKYIDTELLVDLIRASVENIESTIDKMDSGDIENMKRITQEGIDSGFVDASVTNEFSYKEIMAGVGIMHIASNMLNSVESLLAKPNIRREIVRKPNGDLEVVEHEITETEITRNMNEGFDAMERYLSTLIDNRENTKE